MGIDLRDGNVCAVEGTDEPGHGFARYLTALRGGISVAGAPAIRATNPQVMFQKIIHDGLVGNAFLRCCLLAGRVTVQHRDQ
jgi:hypothetical protein